MLRYDSAMCAFVVSLMVALSFLSFDEVHAQLLSQTFVSGLDDPVAFVQDPTDRAVQFIVQQGGRIRVAREGALQSTDFLNLTSSVTSGGERGLLGLAFAPDYASSGRFFVNFTNTSGHTVIARFRRSANPLVADAGSRFDLRLGGFQRFISQPFSNHNGGHLAFGPDGYLYIGLGDGGSANDPDHRAQNPNELLGKMLRIDINVPDNDAAGYRIPPDNPFVGRGAREEIWAFGLRNPWRYSFDDVARGGTGGLIIGDVGQNRWEEIDYEPRGQGGRNYGWRNREGAHDNVVSRPLAFQPAVEPILEYGRNEGGSITGGYVYRGVRLGPTYRGRYFFGDFVSGRVWSVAISLSANGDAAASDRREHTAELGGRTILGSVSSFGVDGDGELYVVNYAGAIVRITAPVSTPPTPTGLKIVK